MKHLIAIVLLVALLSGSSALTSGEENALKALLHSFPALADAAPAWSSNTSAACDLLPFYGVTCSDGPEKHITRLHFNILKLNGSIPEEIGELLWLTELSLLRSCVIGGLPSGIGNLSDLKVIELDIVSCPFLKSEIPENFIPEAITKLRKLETLSLISAYLSGTLPRQIGLLGSSLKHLHLENVVFNVDYLGLQGAIPSSLWDLRGLVTLELISTAISSFEDPSLLLKSTRSGAVGSEFDVSDAVRFPSLEVLSFRNSGHLSMHIDPLLLAAPSIRRLDLSLAKKLYSTDRPIQELPLLSELVLDFSAIKWNIQDRFWTNAPHLKSFSALDAFDIDGVIGEDVGKMRNLTELKLTRITGTIPNSIVHCPLRELSLTGIDLPLPHDIGHLNATLTNLSLRDLQGTSILPESFGELTRLQFLFISDSSLSGTIPAGLARAYFLRWVDLSRNMLTGPLPDFQSKILLRLMLSHNQLNGTIPSALIARVPTFALNNNEFSGEIGADVIVGSGGGNDINLSHNQLSGPLPQVSASVANLDFSYNQFTGTIPASYRQHKYLALSNNRLNGSLNDLLTPPSSIIKLEIGYNLFEGTFPDMSQLSELSHLSIAGNNFSGTLPGLSLSARYLDASENSFVGENFVEWRSTRDVQGLEYLDLSHNPLKLDPAFYMVIGPRLLFLSLASIRVGYSISKATTQTFGIVEMDLSSMSLTGEFPAPSFPKLVSLKLNNNLFHTIANMEHMPYLSQLDISNTPIHLDVAVFTSFKRLATINARKTSLFGTLALLNMPSLTSADFGETRIDRVPNFAAIVPLFEKELVSLNIADNKLLPIVSSLNSDKTHLYRSGASAPSKAFPDTVLCYQLRSSFNSIPSLVFDEGLFNYSQCDCDDKHFGLPPQSCFSCPKSGISSCKGQNLVTSNNTFVFPAGTMNVAGPVTQERFESVSNYLVGFFDALRSMLLSTSESALLSTNDSSMRLELRAETCLITTVQVLKGSSNCQSILVTADQLLGSNLSIAQVLQPQCKAGSEGRLCSKCACNAETCWFEQGAGCSKCRVVLRPWSSVALAIGLYIAAFLLLSLMMTVLLRRKRTQSLRSYSQLSIPKRIFYRLHFLTSLGNVSILITFVQIMIVFTEWDTYAKLRFLGVLNGDGSNFGLRCLFPFLADPIWGLLARLSVPFLAITIVLLSVGVASWFNSILEARERREENDSVESSDDSLAEDGAPLLMPRKDDIAVEYPALALATSMCITVTKFFYFGTALASHEYLFSVQQESTKVKYVQNSPWMRSSEAWSLVMASLPAILIFDFVIPAAFLFICWKVRHRFENASIQIYFGTLFETFHRRCFWWEIVNILKKLSIALTLKALPGSHPAQGALAMTILTSTLLVQLSISPWRRKSENIADGASSLLLVAALFYTRPIVSAPVDGVLWYIFALSVTFILASVTTVVWHTWHGVTDYERRLYLHTPHTELQTQREGSNATKSLIEADWSDNMDSTSETEMLS